MIPTVKEPPTTSTKHSSTPASSPETGMTITTMTSTKLSTLKSTDETTMTQTGASTQRTEGNVYFEFMKNLTSGRPSLKISTDLDLSSYQDAKSFKDDQKGDDFI